MILYCSDNCALLITQKWINKILFEPLSKQLMYFQVYPSDVIVNCHISESPKDRPQALVQIMKYIIDVPMLD